MAGDKVMKNVTGVYARLFDHRSVIGGECKYFLREFEGKRNDREVERLKECEQKVRQVEEKIPKSIEQAILLEDLKEKLKIARQSCHNILVKEEEDLHQSRREKIKENSKKDWENFQQEMIKEEEKVKEEFEAEAQKLREKYEITDCKTEH
jgi:hypothetical protein